MKKAALLFLLIGSLPSIAQNALHFDGNNDYISTTSGGISSGSARTVEAWIRTDANCIPTSGGKQKVILDMGAFGTGTRYTLCLLWSNSIRIEVGGGGISDTKPLNDSIWHHVAAVYDPSTTTKHLLFIDGQPATSGNLTTAVNTTISGLRIGQRVDGANGFEGEIDEVRVWNVALSDSAISAHYNNEICTPPSNLVAYYSFNQGVAYGTNSTTTTLTDGAGTNNGTLNNFALSGTTSNWTQGASLSAGSVWQDSAQVCLGMWAPDGSSFWDSTGTYSWNYVGSDGCDSTVDLTLTVTPVDTSVSVQIAGNITLTSNEIGANYQWVNCSDSTLISGETGQSFMPTQNGDYAVVITKGTCDTWSTCSSVTTIGMGEFPLSMGVYPNPATHHLQISPQWQGQNGQIINLQGEVLWKGLLNEQLDISELRSGSYILYTAESTSLFIKL